MLSAFAQFERSLIRERQREGIAKTKGTVYKGRKPALNPERLLDCEHRLKLAKEFGINRETFYQYIRKKEERGLSQKYVTAAATCSG